MWLINEELEPSLFTLVQFIRNAAGTDIVSGFQNPQVTYSPPGFNGNEFGMLMGKPIIPCEYMAPLGTAGDIALVDLSQYLMIEKGPVQEATSIHVRFIYDETCFRFVYRANGQPVQETPTLPYRGTLTKSAFVALATRA